MLGWLAKNVIFLATYQPHTLLLGCWGHCMVSNAFKNETFTYFRTIPIW